MKNGIKHLQVSIFVLLTLTFLHLEANAQDYLPVGPQTNVAVEQVITGGWTECYRDTYGNVFLNPDVVLSQCTGDRLMLACRVRESSTLTLLAQGERSDVTFDTGGGNNDVTHIANGVGWYFNFVGGSDAGLGENAWGFVRAGDSVEKNNCDIDTSGANDERLCWHLQDDIGGYRCGATEDLNSSNEYERIVYVPGTIAARPIPTLSEWGLIAMAGILGLVGLIAIRKKYAAT